MAAMMDQFRETLLHLAATASEQEAYLRTLGTAPSTDELALEFSDAFGVVEEQLDENERRISTRLDRYLEGMSGSDHVQLWTIDALHSAREWACVRKLADEVLRVIGNGSK
ncbi:MAG: hypothetical protein HYV07_11035 [Deltaproteobacteria bacterium]|nr:hypothetical protein [Deltaproteobacteria bacterium]